MSLALIASMIGFAAIRALYRPAASTYPMPGVTFSLPKCSCSKGFPLVIKLQQQGLQKSAFLIKVPGGSRNKHIIELMRRFLSLPCTTKHEYSLSVTTPFISSSLCYNSSHWCRETRLCHTFCAQVAPCIYKAAIYRKEPGKGPRSPRTRNLALYVCTAPWDNFEAVSGCPTLAYQCIVDRVTIAVNGKLVLRGI